MSKMEIVKNTDVKINSKLIILIVLTVAVTAFIWSNSAVGIEESKNLSGGIMELIKNFLDPYDRLDDEVFHVFIRKTAHFTEFFVLGMLYALIRRNSGKYSDRLLFLPPFATLFTAVCDEFLQSFTGRGTAVSDVMLDFAGAVCGVLITEFVCNSLKNKKEIN